MTDLPPLKTWQFYSACKRLFGMEALQKLFKRSKTQIYRWARNPDTSYDVERNPLDRLNVLLERLCEIGREEIARSAVEILARTIECELRCVEPSEPDKCSIEAECLDDYPALSKFHQAIQRKDDPDAVRHLWQESKRELNETWEMFCRQEGE